MEWISDRTKRVLRDKQATDIITAEADQTDKQEAWGAAHSISCELSSAIQFEIDEHFSQSFDKFFLLEIP